MNSAIAVEDLAKRYRIGGTRLPYETLRDRIASAAVAPFKRIRSILRGEASLDLSSTIWALDGASFEINEGEVVGIIGHNGAGKTTLLKLLSRITEPTRGEARIRGRVGSLLEVGTGFHPELTGRENVYLNGAILGMTRSEITSKFARIVEFSEVGEFLETPIKFYSSGMAVRLAFAVAAHLEPEVILIDEVLAVGDASFQRKCIGSIRETTSSGRTALIVSHNMAFVRALCSRVILLSRGKVIADGPTDEVVARYYNTFRSEETVYRPAGDRAELPVHVAEVRILDHAGRVCTEFPAGEQITVEVDVSIQSAASIRRPWVGVRFYTAQGELISHVANREAGFELAAIGESGTVRCQLPELPLLPGEYFLGVVLADADRRVYDQVEHALGFTVSQSDVFGSGVLPSPRLGSIFLHSSWELAGLKRSSRVGGPADHREKPPRDGGF